MTDVAYPINARWTDDCQGKKDYDGIVVSISTRYWPRGGGFWMLDSHTGQFEENEARPHILPSATSSLSLHVKNPRDPECEYGEMVDLVKQKFTGETQEEVQYQVEMWAQEQMDRLVEILTQYYPGMQQPNRY